MVIKHKHLSYLNIKQFLQSLGGHEKLCPQYGKRRRVEEGTCDNQNNLFEGNGRGNATVSFENETKLEENMTHKCDSALTNLSGFNGKHDGFQRSSVKTDQVS